MKQFILTFTLCLLGFAGVAQNANITKEIETVIYFPGDSTVIFEYTYSVETDSLGSFVSRKNSGRIDLRRPEERAKLSKRELAELRKVGKLVEERK